jgi:hypothetical protein
LNASNQRVKHRSATNWGPFRKTERFQRSSTRIEAPQALQTTGGDAAPSERYRYIGWSVKAHKTIIDNSDGLYRFNDALALLFALTIAFC